MPSKSAKGKAKLRRMDAAIAALTPLGFEKKHIRATVNRLVKEYGDNEAGWYFLEEDYYKLLIETIIKEQEVEQERSNVVYEEEDEEHEVEHEEQGVAKEEQDQGGATKDATARKTSVKAITQYEVGSSSNMGRSGMGEYSAGERALVNYEVGEPSADESALMKLAEYCEMVRELEEKHRCWISKEEEEQGGKNPSPAPKRASSHGRITDEEEDDDD